MPDSPVKRNMNDHNGSQVALILINSLVFATAGALVHLWAFPHFSGDLLMNSYRNLTENYEIPVLASNWVDYLWPVIFFWLLLCKVYTWILLCRKNPVGPSYKSPPVIGGWFLFFYTLALFCVVAWVLLWDRMLFIPTAALLLAAAIFSLLATAVLYKSVHAYGAWMARHTKADLWLYRIFWHNGMAALTTWLTLLGLYFLGVALREEANMSDQDVVYIVLGSISGVMILWFLLENTVLDRYGRYTVTPYIVIIVLMVGIYTRQYGNNSNTDATNYFIASLLGAASFCLALRLALVIGRAFKCPLYRDNKIGEDPVISFGERGN